MLIESLNTVTVLGACQEAPGGDTDDCPQRHRRYECQSPPYFILIERALRDEGTSYHYLPPGEWSEASPELIHVLRGAFDGLGLPVLQGPTWTTDATFRETASLAVVHAAANAALRTSF